MELFNIWGEPHSKFGLQ